MKTYEDLLENNGSEKDKRYFIMTAINDYKSSETYRTAWAARE